MYVNPPVSGGSTRQIQDQLILFVSIKVGDIYVDLLVPAPVSSHPPASLKDVGIPRSHSLVLNPDSAAFSFNECGYTAAGHVNKMGGTTSCFLLRRLSLLSTIGSFSSIS